MTEDKSPATNAAKRKAVRRAVMAAEKTGVRRVYVLPKELVSRVLNHQMKMLLPTEVAAARDLLDRALTKEGF